MIRTKTTVVVGAGAAVEIDLPDPRELLNRVAQGFDFQRLGTDLETEEMRDFDAFFKKVKGKREALHEAAIRIRAGSRLSSSMHALLQQHGDDQHVLAVGKLAMAYYTLRAEAHSLVESEPRDPGDMPLRGSENWLFQLARMVVDGVPRARAESCFDNLHIVNFNTDRAIQHYMPWALSSAFGMDVTEAQELCAEKLKVIQPFGRAGRLDWQPGSEEVADWGAQDSDKLFTLAECIRTAGEFLDDRAARATLYNGLGKARRIVFLGFGFNAMETALLFDERLTQAPEALAALRESETDQHDNVRRVLNAIGGISTEAIIGLPVTHSWKLLRDYNALLES
ncbi:hypothetical protein OZN62_03035 [Aurantiacibacter sp. MUD11]|uniref:hypothetical protein n=1 Tax=Aurantiacibacter sp. MUD11 TaxID=3003265 RepID=UPI0022AA16CE|nr:hypothetical protein [Aurantiacibacter sp. MUD11]WAT18571.1 hypothetical protein OZN62_03035 [Aurantiacibacter sp. MUD11]